MAWKFTPLLYGWKLALGITLADPTIYVANNARMYVNQSDVIELAIGTDERCLAIQTADGSFPVPRPSFVRSWYSNSYASAVTNDATNWTAVLHTNIFTNAFGWRTDQAMLVSLDATLKSLVPYYKDPVTFAPLTFTGLLVSLNLGDGTNFTQVPAWVGTNGVTNAATYGPWANRMYVTAFEERYKVLNALQYSSNSYMWKSNDIVYLWKSIPPVPGLSPRWRGKLVMEGFGGAYGFSWSNITEDIEEDFGSHEYNDNASGPVSYTTASWGYYGNPIWQWGYEPILACAGAGVYEIGPFPTNQTHAAIVRARSVAYGDGWTSAGAIADEGEWVTIINVTNSLDVWEYSTSYGGNAFPAWCADPAPIPDNSHATGNINQVEYTTWYGPSPSHWTRNGDELTNSAFGTNYTFYYCTNKYW